MKEKFNPQITMIKLNPEQAVLACSCFTARRCSTTTSSSITRTICLRNNKNNVYCNRSTRASAASS